MTVTQLIRRTRRLLAEHTAGFWDDSLDVLPALNAVYAKAQACVAVMGRPQDFAASWNRDLTANVAVYPRLSYEPVAQYRRLSGTAYVQCNVLTMDQIVNDADGNTTRWPAYPNFAVVEFNTNLILFPTPTANQTAGLRVVLRSPLALVASTDEPRLPAALHDILASGATAFLMSEERTTDEKKRAQLQAEFDEFFRIRDPRAIMALQRVYSPAPRYIMSAVPQTIGGLTGVGGTWRGWRAE